MSNQLATDTSFHPPTSTPSRTTAPPITALRTAVSGGNMDDVSKDDAAAASERQETDEPAAKQVADDPVKAAAAKKKAKCVRPKHKKRSKAKRKKSSQKKSSRDDSSSDSDSDDESASDDSSDSSSEEEQRKKKSAKSKAKKASKRRRKSKTKKQESESDSEESESEESSSSSEDESARRRKKTKKAKKAADTETEEAGSDGEDDMAALQLQLQELSAKIDEMKTNPKKSALKKRRASIKSTSSTKRKSKKADGLDYKRVDQLWDSTIHNYKLKESAEEEEGEFTEYAFLVRRRFDWENKYQSTVIDIKSKALRAVLAVVMKDCKSVSLEAEEPTIDPNLLFLYLEDLRTYYRKTLKNKIKTERKKKVVKKLEQQKAVCRTLVQFIDDDYAETKKTLYPLLAAGNITFDLLWALFTPNDIAITSCYGAWEHPRCFKADWAMKYATIAKGEWYCIEGKYMEYDGKSFGFGDFEVDIESFKGPRKITSLAAYPLKYHRDPEGIRKQIIARGEKFVNMEGMQYRSHKGLAFMKKKKAILKINISGRIIVDPATFRRVNANYPISIIKPKESDDLFSDSEDDDCSCCSDPGDDDAPGADDKLEDDEFGGGNNHKSKFKYKWVEDAQGEPHYVAVEVDEDGEPIRSQQIETLDKRTYTEEQLLLTSPVVLGFAFSEKLWLEFSLSGVEDIVWNDDAYDSLVLPNDKKSTVRALVESHKFHPAQAIDDVIQGKGKGLVFVLHGPPGTGKTLTAESVSEALRSPLYIVSAGELGTDPARLEQELQKILDIAHSWGALLLLDEADVFLEKREVHDIHRNALVSIFLRLLEYFQGILFLTTNRVETFDDAFQSRIHVALRYDELTPKARKEIWKNFIERVRKQGELNEQNDTKDVVGVDKFSEEDFVALSRHRLNGRQIKNMARTAQALAINEGQKLTMGHIKRVLDVAETFDRDLKGGAGYLDAMRSYT
ncbi:hypothetical protein CKM354_000922100 [Cercospora kikuchii]|uniref:AAA+ ATPase domain-containing protein n=1 Tax=Cercospora kikuchii TaxID=84275 RepID=A0A9P3FJ16_9PEZI|nr:uncharacterized protein CKM354_000922100 [Cercospora kikuchii]GIZ46082.1 hypothetical protein CKM354_000922100 [Cercospora kikuchii]